jgi:hypothetical protein
VPVGTDRKTVLFGKKIKAFYGTIDNIAVFKQLVHAKPPYVK